MTSSVLKLSAEYLVFHSMYIAHFSTSIWYASERDLSWVAFRESINLSDELAWCVHNWKISLRLYRTSNSIDEFTWSSHPNIWNIASRYPFQQPQNQGDQSGNIQPYPNLPQSRRPGCLYESHFARQLLEHPALRLSNVCKSHIAPGKQLRVSLFFLFRSKFTRHPCFCSPKKTRTHTMCTRHRICLDTFHISGSLVKLATGTGTFETCDQVNPKITVRLRKQEWNDPAYFSVQILASLRWLDGGDLQQVCGTWKYETNSKAESLGSTTCCG